MNFLVDFMRNALQHVTVEDTLLDQKSWKANHRITLGFGCALGGRIPFNRRYIAAAP